MTTVGLLSVLCLFYKSHNKVSLNLKNNVKQKHKITILFIIAFIVDHFMSSDIIKKSYLILIIDLLIDTFY